VSDSVEVEITVEAEDAIKAIEEYQGALEGLEKASDIDLGKLEDAFESSGTAAEQAIGPMEEFLSATEEIESGTDTAIGGLEELVSSFEEGGSGAEEFASAMSETGAGISEFSGSAEEGSSSAEALTSALETTTGASDSLANGLSPLAGTLDEVGGSAGTLGGEMETVSGTFDQFAQASAETSSAVSELGGIFTEFGTGVSEASSTVEEMVGSNSALADSLGVATGGLGEMTTLVQDEAAAAAEAVGATEELGAATEEVGSALETSAGSFDTFNDNIGASIGFFGQASSGVIGLVREFHSMEKAQLRVETAERKVSTAREALAKATDKLVTLQQSGTATAEELAQAQLDVDQAQQALSIGLGRLSTQQDSFNLKSAEFYLTIGPNIIQTFTGIIAGITQMPQAFSQVASVLGRVSGVFRSSSSDASVFSNTMSDQEVVMETWGHGIEDANTDLGEFGNNIGTTAGGVGSLGKQTSSTGLLIGGLGAAIGIAAVALGVISTNTFGARDALNALGQSLGDTLPPLQGVLVAVQNFAVDIGLAGEDAKAQVTNFKSLSDQIVEMAENMDAAGAVMEKSASASVSKAGTAVRELSGTVKTEGASIATEVSGWGKAFEDFGAALGRQDWSAALDLITAGFKSIGTVALDSIMVIGDAYTVGQQAWIGTLQDFAFNAGNLLLEGARRISEGFNQAFISGVTALGQAAWDAMGMDTIVDFATNVAKLAGEALNSLSTYVQDAASATWSALGLQKLVGWAEDIGNQIGATISTAVAGAQAALAGGGPEPGAKTPGPGPKREVPTVKGPRAQEDPSARIAVENFKAIAPVVDTASKSLGVFAVAQGKAGAATSATAGQVGAFTPPLTTLSSTVAGTNDNFERAAQIFPSLSSAAKEGGLTFQKVSDIMGADYANALQTATNAGITLTDQQLGAKNVAIAFADGLGQEAAARETALGAAQAYIVETKGEAALKGLTIDQTLALADSIKQEETARAAVVSNLQDELTKRQQHAATMQASAADYIGLANAQKNSAQQNEAIAKTFDPLNEGMRLQNENTRAVSEAYHQLVPAQLATMVGYQNEAQQLALNNLFTRNANLAILEMAQAKTKGVQAGVAFANSVQTEAAQLQGYRLALSEAALGNQQLGDALGLTTGQMERMLTFTNDVIAAQEGIIDSGAELVNQQQVQIEAWRTMSQAQLDNLNATNQQRLALTSLNSPLANNAANIQKLNEAFIEGREAANDFALGLRTTSAEAAGYKQRLNELLPATKQVGDTSAYTVEQMERLVSAFSNTAEGARQMASAMLEAADSFIGMLKFDPEELRTNVSDAFEEVPEWIRDTMSENLQEGIVRQADISRVGDQLVQNTGAAIVGAMRTSDPLGALRDYALESLGGVFEELDPVVRTALAGVENAFLQIANTAKAGGEPTIAQLQKLGQSFTEMAVAAERAKDPFAALYQEINGISTITPQMAANLVQLEGGLKSMALQGASAELALGKVGQQAAAGEVPIVKLRDAASGVTSTFANVNGQLVPVQTGLSALVGPAQLAGNALLGLGTFANAAVVRLGDVMEAFNNLVLTLGPHVVTLNTYFTVTIPTALMATQNAFVAFSSLFVANFALMISTMAAHVTTLNTYFTVTIPTAFMASQNAMVAFTTMFVANMATLIAGLAAHVTTINTYFGVTIPAAFLKTQTALTTMTTAVINGVAQMIAALGAHVTTIVTYFATTIPAAATTFATAVTTAMNAASTAALTFRNNMAQTSTDSVSALAAIATAASSMATAVTSGMNSASSAALTFRNNMEQVSQDVISALAAMESKASSVSSSIASSFGRIGSAASSAASEVDNLRSSIDSLKDKTVTITTRYRTIGAPAGAQHGFQGIVDHRQNLTVGEYGKPELVSVIPLTNPNRISDKTIDTGRLANAKVSASGPSVGMQAGGRIIATGGQDMGALLAEVRKLRQSIGDIRVQSTTVLDGRIIDQNIQQRRMRRTENFG
jgi:hypothetical protein